MPIVRIKNSSLLIEVLDDDETTVLGTLEVPAVKIDSPEYEVTHGDGDVKAKKFKQDKNTGDIRLKIHKKK